MKASPNRHSLRPRPRAMLHALPEKIALVRRPTGYRDAHPRQCATVFSFAGDGRPEHRIPPAGAVPGDTGGPGPVRDRFPGRFGQSPAESRPATDHDELNAELAGSPASSRSFALAPGPRAPAKPVHLRLSAQLEALQGGHRTARASFRGTNAGPRQIEDSLPLTGIDWQIQRRWGGRGRFGADVATVGRDGAAVTKRASCSTPCAPHLHEGDRPSAPPAPEKTGPVDPSTPCACARRRTDPAFRTFVSGNPCARLAQIDRSNQTRYFRT